MRNESIPSSCASVSTVHVTNIVTFIGHGIRYGSQVYACLPVVYKGWQKATKCDIKPLIGANDLDLFMGRKATSQLINYVPSNCCL